MVSKEALSIYSARMETSVNMRKLPSLEDCSETIFSPSCKSVYCEMQEMHVFLKLRN